MSQLSYECLSLQIVLLLQAAEYIEPAFDVYYQSESHYGRDLLRDYNFSCLTDIHIFLTCSHVTVIVLRSIVTIVLYLLRGL